MNALSLLTILLKLAAYLARRAERSDIEKAVLNEVQNIHSKRVDRAVSARDDVLSGRVLPEPDDEFRRD